MGKNKFTNRYKNSVLSYVKWLFGYTKPYLPQLFLIMFFTGFSSLSVIAFAVLSQKIIDAAQFGSDFKQNIIIYIVIVILAQVVKIIASMMEIIIDEKFSFGIRKSVYERILNTKWIDISKYHTGDLITRLTSDTNSVAGGISYIIPNFIILVVDLIVTFLTLYYYNKGLAVFSLAFAPVAVFVSFIFGRKLKYLQTKLQESESTYRSYIQESLGNIMILKTFCAEEYATERLSRLREDRFSWVYKKSKMNMISTTVLESSFQIGYIVAFVWGVIGISNHTITFGGMTVFLMLVNRIQGPLMEMTGYIPKMASVLSSAERIMEIQDLKEEEKTGLKEEFTGKIGIKIENVSFAYQEELILDNVNLDIKPGEFISIMGESGIGKTTLIQMILAFLDPIKGIIALYDETQSVKIDGGLRKFMSYVPQGNTMFSGTIADVLKMAKQDATDDEIIEALRKADIYDVVSELPNGIHSIIGEKGNGISEGQAQRIAIARALLRNAPILILDEATSGLDENTELKVLKNIRSLSPSPTCILISHRKSVLDYCDRSIQIINKKIYVS